MAKKIAAKIKVQIPGGQATPAPPLGPSLAQYGINISEFCQKFNAQTQDRQGLVLPVEITVYEDRSYDFVIKQPVASQLIKKALGIEKGSGEPNRKKVGKITRAQLREIAKQKIQDMNTDDLEAAVRMLEGTAKNMGIEVVD